MKKRIILIVPLVLIVSALIGFILFSTGSAKAEVGDMDKDTVDKLLKELKKEQALLEKEKEKLDQTRRNLENFKSELDKRYSEYLLKAKDLAEKEEAFRGKTEAKMVDRQIIETYQNIDPEQAAILIKNLYAKDQELATLVMRRIDGKKAGKILEALIPIDPETSTRLAEDALNYYRPKK